MLTEQEIEQLKQEKEEAMSKLSALQEQLETEKKSKDELQGKYDKLVSDQDELRKLNGKLLLRIGEQEENKEKTPPETKLSLEETVLNIMNNKKE